MLNSPQVNRFSVDVGTRTCFVTSKVRFTIWTSLQLANVNLGGL